MGIDTGTPLVCRRVAALLGCAFLALAAEMIATHLALPTRLGWKLVPIVYCIWAGTAMVMFALRWSIPKAFVWACFALCLSGVPLGGLGVFFHAKGAFIATLTANSQIPHSILLMPGAICYLSAFAAFAISPWACGRRQDRREVFLAFTDVGIAALAAISWWDHAVAHYKQPFLTLIVAVILPTVCAVLLITSALAGERTGLRKHVLAACLLLALAGIGGIVAHLIHLAGTDQPHLWLLPQIAPIGGPVAYVGLAIMGVVVVAGGGDGGHRSTQPHHAEARELVTSVD